MLHRFAFHRFALAAAAVLLLTSSLACANHEDQRYYWQHDPLSRFDTFRTYAIERNLEPFFDALDAGAREAVEDEIDRQMIAKGYAKAEPGRQADVVIRYFGGPDKTMMVTQSGGAVRDSTGRLQGRGAVLGSHHYVPLEPSSADDRPDERREGRLVIEAVNPRTGIGMWRATAEEALPARQPWNEAASQRAREAVTQMLKHLPSP